MSKPKLIKGALYEHYKNKRLYRVIDVATHTETAEELVIYEAMYSDHKIYARPKAMFLEEVPDPACSDRTVPRFACLEPGWKEVPLD